MLVYLGIGVRVFALFDIGLDFVFRGVEVRDDYFGDVLAVLVWIVMVVLCLRPMRWLLTMSKCSSICRLVLVSC